MGSGSDKTVRYVILIILTPITAFFGFLGGVVVAMEIGLSLHDNYEYFASFNGTASGALGMIMVFGGAFVGALVPWLTYHLAKRIGSRKP
jgi:hypothetical protein